MNQSNESGGIEFEADTEANNWRAVKYYHETTTPKIVQLVVKHFGGYVNEKQASYVLLGFVAVVVAISLFLFFNSGPTRQKPTPTSIKQMEQFKSTVRFNNN